MDLASLYQLLQPYLAGQLRHALTVVAGILIAKGALSSDQQGAFVTIASGMVMYLIGAGWSWWQKSGQAAATARLQRAYDSAAGQLAAMRKPAADSVGKQ